MYHQNNLPNEIAVVETELGFYFPLAYREKDEKPSITGGREVVAWKISKPEDYFLALSLIRDANVPRTPSILERNDGRNTWKERFPLSLSENTIESEATSDLEEAVA